MALPHLPSGLLLKIAMGATTVTAAVAGAGAVGALPGPAQAVFTASVEAVTPFQVGGDDGTEQIDDEVTIPTTTLPEDEQDAPTTLPDDDATDDGIDDATDDATDDTTDDGIDDAVDDGTSDDSDDADAKDRGGRGNGANKANDKAKKGKGPKHDR